MENDIKLIIVDELNSSSSSSSCLLLCRICHEEEHENSTSMESPCACSGSLKFAHRRCIQRWCDEKGSSVCEICLQNFEPGYSVPSKLALLDTAVIIRGSLQTNNESQNTRLIDEDESDINYRECSSPSDTAKKAPCFRPIVLILMLILLTKHLIIVVSTGEGHYPFALTTVLLLRATGILLPFYFMKIIITTIQNEQQRHRIQLHRRDASQMQTVEEAQPTQHTIQIHL